MNKGKINELSKTKLDKAEEMRMLIEEVLAKNSTDLMVRAQVEATKKNIDNPSIDIKEQTKIEFKKIVKEVLNEKYIQSQKDKKIALNYAKKDNSRRVYKRAAEIYDEIEENRRKKQIPKINPKLIKGYNNKLKQDGKKLRPKKEESKKSNNIETSHEPVPVDKQLQVINNNGVMGNLRKTLSKFFKFVGSKEKRNNENKRNNESKKIIKKEKGATGPIVVIIKNVYNGCKQRVSPNDLYRQELGKLNTRREELNNQAKVPKTKARTTTNIER